MSGIFRLGIALSPFSSLASALPVTAQAPGQRAERVNRPLVLVLTSAHRSSRACASCHTQARVVPGRAGALRGECELQAVPASEIQLRLRPPYSPATFDE